MRILYNIEYYTKHETVQISQYPITGNSHICIFYRNI